MGKKKTKQSHVPGTKWTLEDQALLLAWLDHTLENEHVIFLDTITGHLERKFTLNQITSKLWRLWDRCGPNPPIGCRLTKQQWRDEKSILKEGSSCLALSEGLKTKLAREKQSISDNLIAARLAQTTGRSLRSRSSKRTSVVSKLTTTSRTTTHSRKILSTRITSSSWKTKRQLESPELGVAYERPQWHQRDTVSKRRKTQLSGHDPADRSDPDLPGGMAKKKVPEYASEQRSAIVTETDAESSLSVGPIESILSEGRVSPESRIPELTDRSAWEIDTDPICSMCVLRSSGPDFSSCSNCFTPYHVKCLRQLCKNCITAERKMETGITISTSSAEFPLQTALIEIATLKDELVRCKEDLEAECEDRRQNELDISVMRAARDLRDTAKLELALSEGRKEVEKLRKELAKTNESSIFAQLKPTSHNRLGSDEMHLALAFGDIFRESKQILYGYESQVLPSIPDLMDHAGLQNLIRNALDVRGNEDLQREFESVLSVSSPHALVRALAASALQRWVFEGNFPSLHENNDPVLSVYRNVVFHQAGSLALRNLDLASLSTIVQDSNSSLYVVTIPKMANDLAVRFSNTLAPFFTPDDSRTPENSWDNFATWGQNKTLWRGRQYRLFAMFERALRTKARMAVNLEDYEIVRYYPGQLYNGDYMEVETNEGMPCIKKSAELEGKEVELCIQWGIAAVPRVFAAEAGMEEITLNARNIRNGWRATEGRILMKSVVVMRQSREKSTSVVVLDSDL